MHKKENRGCRCANAELDLWPWKFCVGARKEVLPGILPGLSQSIDLAGKQRKNFFVILQLGVVLVQDTCGFRYAIFKFFQRGRHECMTIECVLLCELECIQNLLNIRNQHFQLGIHTILNLDKPALKVHFGFKEVHLS